MIHNLLPFHTFFTQASTSAKSSSGFSIACKKSVPAAAAAAAPLCEIELTAKWPPLVCEDEDTTFISFDAQLTGHGILRLRLAHRVRTVTEHVVGKPGHLTSPWESTSSPTASGCIRTHAARGTGRCIVGRYRSTSTAYGSRGQYTSYERVNKTYMLTRQRRGSCRVEGLRPSTPETSLRSSSAWPMGMRSTPDQSSPCGCRAPKRTLGLWY